MKISEAKQCIKELYLNTRSVICLISERGVGKTSAFQQCAKELGIGYIGLYAAALEGPDFMGLPDKDKEMGITRYLAPQFLPTVQAVKAGLYPKQGLLVLEEINRVPSDTTSVLYPLLLEKKINGHDLAKGWNIGVTMNPDTMNYMVNSLDDAMLDRFISIEVEANLEDYLEYTLQNNPNDEVLSFLQACPDMLLVVKKSAESTATTKSPTPRGWTKIQEVMNSCQLSHSLLSELISGIVGPQAAGAFYGFLDNRNLSIPSSDIILTNYAEVRPAINNLLVNGRLDILNYVIKKVITTFKLEQQHLVNMNAFIENLPEELQIMFFKYLATKRPEDFEKAAEYIESFSRISDRMIDFLSV
ncbi:MAG: hypothetical protein CVU87_11700 [Firmicutes bacterium HGW-Firmicutes-12]|jgi:hypothetical protein|nr:MAG: hypothetical protein CVU87_11700 [Firmicutes bacterium HGW-Firmicutes-12]